MIHKTYVRNAYCYRERLVDGFFGVVCEASAGYMIVVP